MPASDDVLVEGCKLLALAYHAFIVGGDHLSTHISAYDVADVDIVLVLILLAFDALFGHQGRVGSDTVEHAHGVCLADLVQISCVEKEFHYSDCF